MRTGEKLCLKKKKSHNDSFLTLFTLNCNDCLSLICYFHCEAIALNCVIQMNLPCLIVLICVVILVILGLHAANVLLSVLRV